MEKAAGRPLSEIDIARLSVLVFLHDCGKLHPGFQAKGWPDGLWPGYPHGHLQEGAAIVFRGTLDGAIARNLHVETIAGWGEPDAISCLVFAALAHHGRPFEMPGDTGDHWWKKVPPTVYDPLAASASIGALMPDWFASAFSPAQIPLPGNPGFQHMFCGLVSLADWLGSDTRTFKFVERLDPDYMDLARERAARAVAGIGLETTHWRYSLAGRDDHFSRLTGGKSPRSAQEAVGTHTLEDPLIILEAETGSGKTEAALWHFARLFAAGKVDSLYFALPTRAAAIQIHARIVDAMHGLFGEDAPAPVLAVPGYIRAGTVEGQALPDFAVLWADDPKAERDHLARWAAENAKRYLAAPIAVGTVDQAMLAGLQVRHAHLRAAALSRSLLVIDEVHASDPYMTRIQTHLLDMHRQRGGYGLLMSATLGANARVQWIGGHYADIPDFETACTAPYPAVWGSADTPQTVTGGSNPKSVHMELAASWSATDAASRAIAAAKSGAKVLVIRNTVGAALETFEAVRKTGAESLLLEARGGPALHHSRFAPEDRKLLDAAVELALSPDLKKRPAGGAIIIGTQTLEQSLDIDADLLVTDLCPADVLLQRIGRLHRHDIARPKEFEAPRCLVLGPEGGLDRLAEPSFENGLGGWRVKGLGTLAGIYTNLHACELTRRLIAAHPQWRIPHMNRMLVEGATHSAQIDALNTELGVRWLDYWNMVSGGTLAEKEAAQRVLLPIGQPMIDSEGNARCFVSDEEAVRTRLGAEGASISFAQPVTSPFGQTITGITLPGHWRIGVPPDELVPVTREGETLVFAIGEKNFQYTRSGLNKGDQ